MALASRMNHRVRAIAGGDFPGVKNEWMLPGQSLWMALGSVMSQALGVSVGSWVASQAPRVL